jgi:hypothetical protein
MGAMIYARRSLMPHRTHSRKMLVLFLLPAASSFAQPNANRELSPVCIVAEDLDDWVDSDINENLDDDRLHSVQDRHIELQRLCQNEPTQVQLKEGASVLWLTSADDAVKKFSAVVVELIDVKPFTENDRKRVREAMKILTELQNAVNWYRVFAYQSARTAIAEMPKNPCFGTLRSGARGWSDMLYTYTNAYTCQGCPGYDFAKETAPQLRNLSSSSEDPVPVLVGWLNQYYHVLRKTRADRESGRAGILGGRDMDERVQRVAVDMRTRLSTCGVAAGHRWDEHN